MNWRKWLGLKPLPKRVTMEDVARIHLLIMAEQALEDEKFERYLALPDRPKIKQWIAFPEGDPLHYMNTVDWDDWNSWRKENP